MKFGTQMDRKDFYTLCLRNGVCASGITNTETVWHFEIQHLGTC